MSFLRDLTDSSTAHDVGEHDGARSRGHDDVAGWGVTSRILEHLISDQARFSTIGGTTIKGRPSVNRPREDDTRAVR